MGFHPSWSDNAIGTQFNKRVNAAQREIREKERQAAKAAAAAQPSKTYIYFIQQGDDGPIKVGYSTSPEERLRALQTASPYSLRLLKVVEGGEALEKQIHTRFAENQLQGEWFQPTDTFVAYLESLH